jgi:LytS/YehU family sensor histidine kinase
VTFVPQIGNPSIKIAPLIFISLIENAFKHGISPTKHSFVHINIVAILDEITFSIENSNHPKTNQDRSGHGIGLSQVQRRLDLAYPGRYTWEKGVSGDGTVYKSTIHIQL